MHVGKELPGKFPAAGPVRMRRRRGKGGGVEGGKWEGGKGEGGKGGEGIIEPALFAAPALSLIHI